MEKMPIFTQEQKLIFDKISKSEYFRSNFYFTGGTALSEFYLKHRLSEDLDFFSEKKFENEQINIAMKEWARALNFTFQSQFKEVVYMYFLKFKNKPILKIDFGYYPVKRVEKGLIYKNIEVDSLFDIAINKFDAMHSRSTGKDMVDLFFLLKKFTIWDLMEGARVKFGRETDPWILSSDIEYVIKELLIIPRMIKPLKLEELKKFFHDLAMKLGKKAVK